MRICIIGAGYVGLALAETFKQRGAHVTVTTTTPSRVYALSRVADRVWLLDGSGLAPFNKELSLFDAVMVTVAPNNRSLEGYRACYLGTVEQLLAARVGVKSFPHVFYTSSTSVYGEYDGADVTETTPPVVLDPYATLLYQTEQLLIKEMEDSNALRVTVLRLGEIIGPGREVGQRLRGSQNKAFAGDGTRLVNITHLNAIIQAISFCYAGGLTGLYNLCSNAHPTRAELYRMIAEREGLPLPVWDPQLQTSHQGNKRVLSSKIADSGFCYPEEPL